MLLVLRLEKQFMPNLIQVVGNDVLLAMIDLLLSLLIMMKMDKKSLEQFQTIII